MKHKDKKIKDQGEVGNTLREGKKRRRKARVLIIEVSE